jgi:signal transduction histidine kinase
LKLRTRLLWTTVIAAVPLIASLLWYERRTRYTIVESALTASVLDAMRGDALERCEREPDALAPSIEAGALMNRRGAGHGRGLGAGNDAVLQNGVGPRQHGGAIRWYAYDGQLHAHRHDAPTIDPRLVRQTREGRPFASRPIDIDGRAGFEALVAIPGGKACSFVLAQRPIPAVLSSTPFQLRTAIAWLFPSLGLLMAVYLGLGLLVRRVTKLTRDVRASASSDYADLPSDGDDDEIAELRRAFAEAGREIRNQLAIVATKEKILREFLANTTHDVMLPLTVLNGHLAELAARKLNQAEANDALSGALRESHYIGSLLRNLALAAKLDGERFVAEDEWLDLGAVVTRATLRHQFLAKQQHVELNHAVPEHPVRVRGESVAIEQALSNVIFNAVVYNRPSGHVAVLLEVNGERFTLRVLDDGPGVSDEELSRIVERHYRGDSSRSRSQGSGLGLDIAQRVSAVHGWTMTLGKAEAGGLVVTFVGALASFR